MSNFKLIRKDIDISPFLEELELFLQKGGNWNLRRAEDLRVQQHTKHIELRSAYAPRKDINEMSKDEKIRYAADCEYHELSVKTYPFFTKTYAYLEQFADEIGGQLTRVMIVTLAPRTQVYPHIDAGSYYLNKDRYHIPLKTKGSENRCEDEHQTYYEGELWWFDNKKVHEAFNHSDEERIHIIFDVLPQKRSLLRRMRDHLEKSISLMRHRR